MSENETAVAQEAHLAHEEPNYMAVFGALFVLTVAEVGVVVPDYPQLFTGVALVVMALTKAFLVAAYFMHLKFETGTLMWIAACPLILCGFLLFMLTPDALNSPWLH